MVLRLSALFGWVRRCGPFIEKDRLPEEEDLSICFGHDVTNGRLGEAGRRLKAAQVVASMSFPGGVPDFAQSPLPVVHGLEGEPIGSYPVEKFLEPAAAIAHAIAAGKPAESWRSTIETARVLFPKLILPDAIWEDSRLARQPFDAVVRDCTYVLLGRLDRYMCGRNLDRNEGPAALEVVKTYFMGDRAMFPPETPTNQRDFRKDMKF